MTQQETKQCQNCKLQFVVESEDFAFYAKVKVPAPTFCSECRNARRMSWRNERSLYKRKCNAPGHEEEIISMYAPEAPYRVVDTKYWWSDSWDPLEYGAEYDFQKPFFLQFTELMKRVPLINLSVLNSVSSDYTNYVDGNKNCYLVFASGWNENVNYGNKIMGNKDSNDLLGTTRCELSYECVNCVESYGLRYSTNCKSCTDAYFLYGCRNCTNCFACANLSNRSYCIFNTQYSKEEYEKELAKLNPHGRRELKELGERFRNEVYLTALHRYASIFASVGCTGDNIDNSKNCKDCFDVFESMEDSRYEYGSLSTKDSYDGNGVYQNPLSCELVDANVGQNNQFGLTLYASNNMRYCWNCHSSSNCFGCIGLRSKNYCILNRQYSKEEYEALIPKIIEQMNTMPYIDGKGREYRYGEYFPVELSPFAYNETIAQEYYMVDETRAKELGYPWHEWQDRTYAPTIRSESLPNVIAETDDSILKEIIECSHSGRCQEQCTKAFRIIPQELDFYRRMNIPLPTLCPNCRHYARLKKKNPMKLWKRRCQCAGEQSENGSYRNTIAHIHGAAKCPTEFETPYSPDCPEIVYCEQCYQQEVS